MKTYRYQALTQSGELVSGSLSAPTQEEVALRIEYLGLIPIETAPDASGKAQWRWGLTFLSRPSREEVTFFTSDLALLLKTGARINEALDLVASDPDIGRLRPTVATLASAILAGEGFADALSRHPALFPPMYVALARVGEASGALADILEVLGVERARAEALRRRVGDALHYPAFVLSAAAAVLIFFLTFVLPQFASVLRDFNAKIDPIAASFLALSDQLAAHGQALAAGLAILVSAGWLILRRPAARAGLKSAVSQLPFVREIMRFHHTALFCRNLGILLSSGVALTTTLRILADMMATDVPSPIWRRAIDLVRRGGKLSDALAETNLIPAMAVRTLRLGEETGQLPILAGRVAEFYEAKLQRSLDRLVGVIGPASIVAISIVVGSLIVSIMTALLSVTQVVG